MLNKIKSLFSGLSGKSSHYSSSNSETSIKVLSDDLSHSILSKNPFNKLDLQLQEEVVKLSKIVSYEKDQLIFVSGEDSEYLPYLLSGKILLQADDGKLRNFDEENQAAKFPLASMNPLQLTAKSFSDNTQVLWVKRHLINKYFGIKNYEVEENAALPEDRETKESKAVEKRNNLLPIPGNYMDFLNESQQVSVKKLEEFGWEVFFIRRSNLDNPITIMHDPNTDKTALIEQNGDINTSHDVSIRS